MPAYVITGSNHGLVLELVRTKIHILECNTASLSSIERFTKTASTIVGEKGKVDFLINNAGINDVPEEGAFNITSKGLGDHINVNVLGLAKVVEGLRNHLKAGSVVMNMTSGLGSISKTLTIKPPKHATYSISKAALQMLTVHQAGELKEQGVVVVCMDPGWGKTDMGGEDAVLL
ncbi:hypothetical protein MMC30_006067 [Trapelia coarctata]|nr:hypothetical protein [Trapelia coarctata]